MNNPTVIELFAGAGGMALGLEKVNFDPVMLIEYDKNCVYTLRENRPQWRIIHKDITEFDFTGHHADVVTGGFPCQPFSEAGKKLGFEDVRGSLFYEFARAVKEIQPKIFLAENVEGILTNNNGKTLQTILSVLESLGYNVQYKMLNAVNFHVPQTRKRVFFVGTLPGINFHFPQPSPDIITVGQALQDVPVSKGAKYPDARKVIFDLVPAGGNWTDLPDSIQKKYLGKIDMSKGGSTGVAHRLSYAEPCRTLLCSPSQKMTERIHPQETRPLTIREYARIQTFPDSWKFYGSLSSQYRQIGNAVPPKLAAALGNSIHHALQENQK